MNHITAMMLTLLIYLVLGFSYYGWGQLVSFCLGLDGHKPENPIMPVWLGWAATVFVFQVLHLFVPLTIYVSIPVFVFGIIFFIIRIKTVLQLFSEFGSKRTITVLILMLFFLVTCWIASRAMLPPINYDSGLYHFNVIRWINAYPIVPGLGNLHGRLALNSSFFPYVSALNFYPVFGHGRSLANSFLLLLVLATILPSIFKVLHRPALLATTHPFEYIADIFLLPVLFYFSLSSKGVASPSPDLTSDLLRLAMFIMLCHGIAEWMIKQKHQNYRAAVLLILAVTAVTIKLSNVAFSATIIILTIIYAITSRPPIRLISRVALFMVFVSLVYILRNIILSGAPFHPSTLGYIPLEWAVPKKDVVTEANWIYSWARMPHAHWKTVLGNWQWLQPWALRMSSDRNIVDVLYPCLLSLCFCLLAVIPRNHKKTARINCMEKIIFLPMLVSLVFWFFTAPDPRFAQAIFFLTAVSSILMYLSSIQERVRKPVFMTLLALTFLVGNIHFAGFAFHPKCLKTISTSGWHEIKKVPLVEKVTLSGLTVLIPVHGDQSWDSPLPSTPYFKNRLQLRRPGDLASGFMIRKTQQKKDKAGDTSSVSAF